MSATEIIQRLLPALLLPWAVGIACAYAWAGIWYALFRFSRAETEPGMRRFFIRHFLPSTRFPQFLTEPRRVTRAGVVQRGYMGWGLVPFPLLLISTSPFGKWSLLLANGLFLQAGLLFAVSWYGQRCLRLLKLDSIGDEDVAAERFDGSGASRTIPPAPSRWSRLSQRADLWRQRMRRGLWNRFSAWAGQ